MKFNPTTETQEKLVISRGKSWVAEKISDIWTLLTAYAESMKSSDEICFSLQ